MTHSKAHPSRAPDAVRRRLRTAAVIVTVWTLVGLFSANQSYLAIQLGGGHPHWSALLGETMWSVWLWALYTPAILWLAARVRVTRANWPATTPVHILAALILTGIEALMDVARYHWTPPATPVPIAADFVSKVFIDGVSYAVIVLLAYAAHDRRQLAIRKVRAIRLAQQLTRARLTALRGQLQPHFLFNTLNAVAELVHVDAAAADLMIMRLAALLRRVVDAGRTPAVSLREELALLDAYVGIIRVRFGDRLTVTVRTDPAAAEALVPALLLQPIVENAIKHGVEPRETGGQVDVEIRRQNDQLVIDVATTATAQPARPAHGPKASAFATPGGVSAPCMAAARSWWCTRGRTAASAYRSCCPTWYQRSPGTAPPPAGRGNGGCNPARGDNAGRRCGRAPGPSAPRGDRG
ncbi:MAG: sensor histidine kinase [Gemmatimonadales bacterium]